MVDVPQQVWQEDHQCKGSTDPDPRRPEESALWRHQKAGYNAEAKDQHRMLVLQPDSSHQAKPKPEFLVASLDDSNEYVGGTTPEEWFESVHGEQIVRGEKTWRDQCRQGGHALRKASASQLASEQAREQNGSYSRQSGKETYRWERIAEHQTRKLCK